MDHGPEKKIVGKWGATMKWLLVGGMFFLSVTFVFAQPRNSSSVEKESVRERLLMGGTEIQGTIEKPHVVYVVPWKDAKDVMQQEVPLERSFREEILKKVDYDRFKRQWGTRPRLSKGGETE